MNGDLAQWNSGLLFAVLCALIGTIGVVSAWRGEDRWLASGLFLQGVLLTFVVGGAYFHGSSSLHLGGLAVVGLLIIQTVRGPGIVGDDQPIDEDAPS